MFANFAILTNSHTLNLQTLIAVNWFDLQKMQTFITVNISWSTARNITCPKTQMGKKIYNCEECLVTADCHRMTPGPIYISYTSPFILLDLECHWVYKRKQFCFSPLNSRSHLFVCSWKSNLFKLNLRVAILVFWNFRIWRPSGKSAYTCIV